MRELVAECESLYIAFDMPNLKLNAERVQVQIHHTGATLFQIAPSSHLTNVHAEMDRFCSAFRADVLGKLNNRPPIRQGSSGLMVHSDSFLPVGPSGPRPSNLRARLAGYAIL